MTLWSIQERWKTYIWKMLLEEIKHILRPEKWLRANKAKKARRKGGKRVKLHRYSKRV